MRSTGPVVTLLGIFALCTSVACGSSDSPAPGDAASTPSAAEMPPSPESPPFAVVDGDEDGSLPVFEGELPAGYPSDVPTYPGSTPATSLFDAKMGGFVSFTSPASDQEVFDFYKKQLAAQGWNLDSTGEDPLSISSSKGDRKTVVQIAAGAESTEILVTLGR